MDPSPEAETSRQASALATYRLEMATAQGTRDLGEATHRRDAANDSGAAVLARDELIHAALEDFELTKAHEYADLAIDLALLRKTYRTEESRGYADALDAFADTNGTPWARLAADEADALADRIAAEVLADQARETRLANAERAYQVLALPAQETLSNTQTEAEVTQEQTLAELNLTRVQAQSNISAYQSGAGISPLTGPTKPGSPAPSTTPRVDTEVPSLVSPPTNPTTTSPRDFAGLLRDSGAGEPLSPTGPGECELAPPIGLHEICFAAGTPVLLANGGSKPIELIEPGELVFSASENNPEGPVVAKVVLQVFHNMPAELLAVRIGDECLKVTPRHLFYVRTKGWVHASELNRGDELRTNTDGWESVSGIRRVDITEPVYNLHVDEFRTYFVSTASRDQWFLVHNACPRFKVLEWNGRPLRVSVPATGLSSADVNAADAIAKAEKRFSGFEGMASLRGTWHHKQFDPRSGRFVMELVDKSEHALAGHTGAYAQYLDWVADVVNHRRINNCLGSA